ncbi:5'/3'-nucleotidase SurE [Pseudodesulfovibrio sp. zrk46]|uniref:5'/3'-nucleotidase SurE n=1 Tax=Pseudodesulfovibrio sp. zrk46 TaxID=2725288 RepID=UPI001448FE1A|nr:5'/3'-nucleotidase SurE [Pseudodesulfovibrio sp. zrk46]QJB58264.1 5'/3'-nucleotidase SurE [Pseudodesulfovibrio sp. zrk46]
MNTAPLPKILITNDDGIHSPGLLAAAKAVSQFAEVTIIAPLEQQTAMGRALRGNPEAKLEPVTLCSAEHCLTAYACDAAPARCVEHGLKAMPEYIPDLVISGINYGENLGNNITASGTVGAAMETAARGIPSLAVSLETPVDCHFEYTSQNWDVAAHFLRYFARQTLSEGLPSGVDILKIDVPSEASIASQWRVTKLSGNRYYQSALERPSLQSRLGDAFVTKGNTPNEEPDTDVYAIAVDKVVSVTPLSLDFTAYDSFSALNRWQQG